MLTPEPPHHHLCRFLHLLLWRLSTTSFAEAVIHISEAFQDISPPYSGEDLTTSSPALFPWSCEFPSYTPTACTPDLTAHDTNSAIPTNPLSQRFSSTADNVLCAGNVWTSTTLDREGEAEKSIPAANFIRSFEYNEWEERDGENSMYTTEGTVGGNDGDDKKS